MGCDVSSYIFSRTAVCHFANRFLVRFVDDGHFALVSSLSARLSRVAVVEGGADVLYGEKERECGWEDDMAQRERW